MRTGIVVLFSLTLALAGCGSNGDKSRDGGSEGGVSDASSDAGQQLLDRDEIIKACLFTSACGIKTYPSLSSCLAGYLNLHVSQRIAPIYNKIYQCVNKTKGDCDAVATCYQRGAACDSTYKATCEGKVAVTCDLQDKRVYKLDCSAAGMECAVKKGYTFSAVCTPGTCYSSSGETCQGSLLYTCVAGLIEVRDCAATGKGCGSTHKSQAACIGNQKEKCSEYFVPSCKKTTIATECVNGFEHYVDCSKNTHLATACKEGLCVTSGSDCTEGTVNRCSGKQLEACLDGKWQKFDCAQLGLGDCIAATNSAQCGKS